MKYLSLLILTCLIPFSKAVADVLIGYDKSGPFFASIDISGVTLQRIENGKEPSICFGLSPSATRAAWFQGGESGVWRIATYNPAQKNFDVHSHELLPSLKALLDREKKSIGFYEPGVGECAIADNAPLIAVRAEACLFILNLDTGEILSQHSAKWHVGAPAWSPDGRFLAYFYSDRLNAERTGGYVLRIYDVARNQYRDASLPSTPTATTFFPRLPVWSKSSTMIFLYANFTGKPGLRGVYCTGPDLGSPPESLNFSGAPLGIDFRGEELYIFTSTGQYAGKPQSPMRNTQMTQIDDFAAAMTPINGFPVGTMGRISPSRTFLLFNKSSELLVQSSSGTTRIVTKESFGEPNWVDIEMHGGTTTAIKP
jgi:hypothetical protein